MRVQIGVGNAITTSFNAAAKTLAFSGAYSFDVTITDLSVYDVTVGAYIFWPDASGTGAAITATGPVVTWVAGLPVQTITFSALPVGAANGDTLVIFASCDDDVALYNSVVTT